MQYHDPQMQNFESTLTLDATPRDDENAREQPQDRFTAGIRDQPSDQSSGGARKYYEF